MELRLYIVFILFLTAVFPLSAQVLTNQGQLIHILSNTTVTIDGSAVNEGTFVNNGHLAISGDWDNRSSYNAGTGTFILNGNNLQFVRHNNQDFYKLQLTGTGEKILASNATITNEFILNSGLVTPTTSSVLLLKENATITGGSTSSYVNGRMFHEGVGYKFFPIGKNGHYKPVALEELTGVTPVIGFEMFEPNTGAQAGDDLKEVSQVRYWQQTLLAGTLNKAFINLSFDNSEHIQDMDSIVVAEADNAGSIYRNIGKSLITGSISGGSITSKLSIGGQVFAIGVHPAEKSILYIPTAFSPLAFQNEDRVIKVYGKNIAQENLHFRVYNRWGNLVFESNSLEEITTKGWDGYNRYTGNLEIGGVYTYTLAGQFINGKTFEKVGTITLIK